MSEYFRELNTDVEIPKLVKWVKDYVEGAGKKGVVIGMSGGVDSAVSFELAKRALGAENVYAVHLPMYTRTLNIHDKLIEYFRKDNVDWWNIDITDIAELTHTVVGQSLCVGNGIENPLTYANIQARTRMNILYALASELDYLVIGTGNLTEHLIGYFTKWGDGAVDFEPLGSYYKYEVYQLAKALDVPTWIIQAPPSAGLWDNQTDEDELGVTYNELDTYFEWKHGMSYGYNECPISEDKVEVIERLGKSSKHKSNTPPIYPRYEDEGDLLRLEDC